MDRIEKHISKALHITCIIPAHNEAECIAPFLVELDKALDALSAKRTLIVVDDGSTDKTVDVIKESAKTIPLKLVKLSRNFGKEKALSAGLDFVADDADVTILIDGDFQHPLSTLKDFIQKWTEGYDMVYGLREDRKSEGFFKRLFTRTRDFICGGDKRFIYGIYSVLIRFLSFSGGS